MLAGFYVHCLANLLVFGNSSMTNAWVYVWIPMKPFKHSAIQN